MPHAHAREDTTIEHRLSEASRTTEHRPTLRRLHACPCMFLRWCRRPLSFWTLQSLSDLRSVPSQLTRQSTRASPKCPYGAFSAAHPKWALGNSTGMVSIKTLGPGEKHKEQLRRFPILCDPRRSKNNFCVFLGCLVILQEMQVGCVVREVGHKRGFFSVRLCFPSHTGNC